MTNAFNWMGAPSIFTTGAKPHQYGSDYVRRNFDASIRKKDKTISLPGGSRYLEPSLMKTKGKK